MPGSPDTTTSPGAPATDAFQRSSRVSRSATRPAKSYHWATRRAEGIGAASWAARLQPTVATGTGSGRPFSVRSPAGCELVVAPAAGQEADEVGDQDLVAAGLGAEPGGLHDRRAEAVVVLQGDVAGADPDAHREPVLGVALDMGADGLLDGDGGTDRLGRAGEQGQDAVAEALDDLAAVGGDGVGQQAVVGPAQRLGPLLAERDPQLGGPDEVGHQDRRRLRSHTAPSRGPGRPYLPPPVCSRRSWQVPDA